MGQKSSIQWTDGTWNVARGCTKVSRGCDFCYMMRDSFDGHRYNPEQVVKTISVFDAPLKWQRQRNALDQKWRKTGGTLSEKESLKLTQLMNTKRVFTSSLTDVFHPDIDSFRDEIWAIIRQCPEFDFQILTKRIERVKDLLPADWGNGYPNVWIGCTMEDQEAFDNRILILLSIPAVVRFISAEPLLSEIDMKYPKSIFPNGPQMCCSGDQCGCLGMPTEPPLIYGIDWVIIGGESGNDTGQWKYRKSRLEWYESIINQCKEYHVPVFMKQLGTWLAKKEMNLHDRHGGEIDEWPDHLKIREFPKS